MLWLNCQLLLNSYTDSVFVSQGLSDTPDLEFEYSDADKWTIELSGESSLIWFTAHFFCTNIILNFQPSLTNCDYNNAFSSFKLFVELYSYTEGPEFLLNRKCFEEDFHTHSKYWSNYFSLDCFKVIQTRISLLKFFFFASKMHIWGFCK